MNEESLFHEALARSAGSERDQFLSLACAERPDLREAVQALLEAHEASGEFLGRAPDETVNARHDNTDPEHESVVVAELVPTHIGRYQVRRPLGRGGMGVVYLAHDPQLDRLVALKVPKLANPGAEERFLREARAAASITHPNLCPVFDAGRADGVLYLAMAYVPGSTLTALLHKEGRLPPKRAAGLAAGIAAGMAEAHRHGIVHRDLKPGNVLVGKHGEPVVTDFGLARRGATADIVADLNETATFDPQLTRAGMVMGTPAYMPPEQARGDVDKVGPASDVYALGAILYELLTGRPPFLADTIAELVRKIEHEPLVPPSRRRPGLPMKLDAICAKALAKDPARRFASMGEFAATLGAFASGGKHRRWVWAGIAAAAFAFITLAGVVLYVKTDYGDIEVRLSDPNAKVEVSIVGEELQLKDGKRLTRIRAGEHTLLVKGDGYETETKKFRIKRGDKTVVEVALRTRAPTSPKAGELTPETRAQLARLLARGRQLIEDGQYQDLPAVADEALRIDPESPGGLALRAHSRHVRGEAGARADADAALKLNPEAFIALLVRSHLNGPEGRLDETIADATVAARIEPKHPAPWAYRAMAYLEKKEYRQAIADATLAEEFGHKRSDHYLVRGAARVMLGDYEKALADYDSAAQRAPSNPFAFIQRSSLYAKLGRAKEAAADWAVAKRLDSTLRDDARPPVPTLPKPSTRKKLTPEAAQALAKAVKAAKDAWDGGRVEECGKAAAKALAIDDTSPDAHGIRALALNKLGQPADALKEANEAIHLEPENAHWYAVRGVTKIDAGEPTAGIADVTIALRIEPRAFQYWDNRGWAYMERGQYYQALADFNESIRLRPDYAPALTNRGKCYAHLGQFDKAIADYAKAVELQPGDARWRFMRSALRARAGDLDGARRDREEAVKLDPKIAEMPEVAMPPVAPAPKRDPEPEHAATPALAPDRARLAGLLARGRQLIDDGQYGAIAAVADEALAIDSESPGALALRATVHTARHDLAEARKDAEAALKLNPETYQALLIRAYGNSASGKHADAAADETAALRLQPKATVARYNRANAYFAMREYRQAIADARQAIEEGDPTVEPRLTLGASHAFLGELDKALAAYELAVTVAPGEPRIYAQRSVVYAKRGDPAKAATDWAQAKKLDPTLADNARPVLPNPPKPPERKKLSAEDAQKLEQALAAFNKGFTRGDALTCRAAAAEAYRLDPTCPAARSNRARIWSLEHKYKEALAEATEAIRLNPDDVWAYISRSACRIALDDYAGGIADATIAIRLDDKNGLAWNNRAWGYSRRGQFHQAIADATESARLRPHYENAYDTRGTAHACLGEYAKALADYEQACEVAPLNGRWHMICAVLRAKLGDLDGARRERALAAKIDPKLADAPDERLPPASPVKKDPEP